MNRLSSSIRDISRYLSEREISFAIVGGIAVSAHTEPRFTRDVDLAINVADDRDAEALVRYLQGVGFRVLAVVEQEETKRLATVRLQSSIEGRSGVVVDLLFASSGIESEIVKHAEELEVFDGLRVPVAAVGHLIALKVLARDDENRPQDAVDLKALINGANEKEIERARIALERIKELKFNRGRDLMSLFESALQVFH
jgi:predicted nucleotidyltransferase